MSFEKHLLIDGPNVMHHWAGGQLRKDAAPRARDRLVAAARGLHDAEQWRVTLVFDGRGPELRIERPLAEPTFSCIDTPASLTADDVIEQLVGQAKIPGDCRVATADQAERRTIEALGAAWISPAELRAWIDRVAARQTRRLTRRQSEIEQSWRASPPHDRPHA